MYSITMALIQGTYLLENVHGNVIDLTIGYLVQILCKKWLKFSAPLPLHICPLSLQPPMYAPLADDVSIITRGLCSSRYCSLSS